MDNYTEYITRIKSIKAEADYGLLYSQIQAGSTRRVFRFDLAICGAIAVLLLSFTLYYYRLSNSHVSSERITEYIFAADYPDGNIVTSYAFDN